MRLGRRFSPSLWVRLAGVFLGLAAGPGVWAAAPTLAECDGRVRRAPDDAESYDCYTAAARGGGLHDQAVRRLDALVERKPPPPAALFNLAVLAHDGILERIAPVGRPQNRAAQMGDAPYLFAG